MSEIADPWNTGRSVPEWIGTTPDSAVPKRVRARVFARYRATCHWSGRPIRAGDAWDVDHVVALANGGENRESNLAPILKGRPHQEKTAQDVEKKSKANRLRDKHFGLQKKRSQFATAKSGRFKQKITGETVRRNGE